MWLKVQARVRVWSGVGDGRLWACAQTGRTWTGRICVERHYIYQFRTKGWFLSLKNRKKKSARAARREATASSGVPRSMSYQRPKRRSFVGPVVLVCALIAVIVMADYWINSGRVYRGVEVGSIALGGKTPKEAESLIEERTSGALKEIKIVGPENIALPASEMGVDFDVESTVEEAYSVGREGSIRERIEGRLDAAFGTVDVSPKVEYERKIAKLQVEELASRFDAKPREAEVNIIGSEVEMIESAEGYVTNQSATLKSINAAVDDMTGEAEIAGRVLEPEVKTPAAQDAAEKTRNAMSEQIVLVSDQQRWTLSPAEIGTTLDVTRGGGEFDVSLNKERMLASLENVFATLTVVPVEATYQIDGSEVSVIPGENGSRIGEDKLLETIQSGIFTNKREYEVPVVTDKPELTTDKAEALKPTEVIGDYRTNYLTYDDTPGRIKNLEIASNAVNNTLLAPEEVFSFNALAEPLDYKDTKVIVGGRVDTAEGGGLCQVSSTLYMAANYAGLDVIERHPHYAELPYIRPGFDATVWFGALDMQFQNTSSGYVLIQQWVDAEGYVNATIYGRPTGKEVKMSSEKVATTKDEDGKPVTEWVTYQKVKENGEVVQNDVLHEDTYKYLKPASEDAPNDDRPPN